MAEEHLVYTAVDAEGKDILSYAVVNHAGAIIQQDAIVADHTIYWDGLNDIIEVVSA
jgi:hypothetical protein